MAFDSHDKIQSKSQSVDLYLTADGQLRVIAVGGDENESRRERERQGATLISRSGAPTLAGVSLLSLLLAACGGGSDSGGGGGGGTSGVVADGYLAGMKVYRDGSPNTFVITDANGGFSGLGGSGAIVAEPGASGATDTSTSLAFLAKLMAPAGATVINPLTTILQMLGANQESAFKTALGLNANINLLTYDPIAANNVAAQLVSAQIGNLLSAAVKNGPGNVAEQLAAKIAAHETIDLTSGAFPQSLGLSANIANAVAKANSVTTTDLAGIAAMQKLVQQLALADSAGQSAALAKFVDDFALTAKQVDTQAPDAPTAITFTAEGGTVVVGAVNSSNTNLTGHANITAGQATGGKAELLVNGLVVATDSTILATDTRVDFSLGSSTATALHNALATGGAVAVRLYDAAGNVISATATLSLIVDYVAPTLTISSSGSVMALKAGETALVTLTFSETPVGFVAGDLTTTLGTLSSLTVSPTNPKVYTATFTPSANTDLSNGSITLTGAFTDAAGNAGAATGPLTFSIDTKAPVAPGLTLASDTGSSHSDGVTNVSTVNVTGLEAGASWQYKIDTGDWTAGTGASLTLQEGAKSYQLRQTDAAGNVSSPSAAVTFTLDTSAPSAPTMSLQLDTGASASDGVTSSSTLDVSGLESGASWEYKIGTGAWTTGEGSHLTLQEGANSYQVRQTDAAGNVSLPSAAVTYTLDTSAPSAPTMSLQLDTGANASDGVTYRSTLNVSGLESGSTWEYKIGTGAWTTGTGASLTLQEGANSYQVRQTDAAGNVSSPSAAVTYTLDTSAPSAPTMSLQLDTGANASDGVTSSSKLNISGLESGATWEYKIGTGDWTTGAGTSLTLEEGAKSYQIRQTDAAGNVSSPSAAVTYTLDTSAPSAPTMSLQLDTGADASDGVTSSSKLNISGLESGATWEFKIGNGDWTTGAGTSLTLDAGSEIYQVRQIDAAGNVSAPSEGVTYTLDTQAPASLAARTPTLTPGTDTGASHSDGVTSNPTPTVIIDLSGQGYAVGDSVVLFDGDTEIARAVLTDSDLAAGLTQYALVMPMTTSLPEIPHSLSIRLADPAGNLSVKSATLAVTIDTTAPTVSMNPIAGADVDPNGFTITGTTFGAEAGQIVSVTLDGHTYQGQVGSDGAWSVMVSAAEASVLSGAYTLSATVSDLAGNVSDAATETLTAPVSGVASDGYISGATYFVDTDGDTLLDEGEASTIGDDVGNYRLPTGDVVMKGGRDISTLLDFTSVYEAPTGYRTITPITTLVREISKLDGHTVVDAEQWVNAIIGHDVNLSTFNPLIEAAQTVADFGAALAYQKIAAELSILMDVGSTLLGHMSPAADAKAALAQTQAFSIHIVQELAVNMTSAADLSNEGFLTSIFMSIALTDPSIAALDNTEFLMEVMAAAAKQIALANSMIASITAVETSASTITALKSITQYQVVAKGKITDELLAYLANPDSVLPQNYDEASLSSEASLAQVGVIVPATITGSLSGEAVHDEGELGSQTSWTFTFTRSGDTSAATELTYEVLLGANGSAKDFDRTVPSAKIYFAAGETERQLTFKTIGNDVAELQKSFSLKVYDEAGKTQFLDSSRAPTGALNFAFALKNDDAPTLHTPDALELQTGIATRVSGLTVAYPDADAQLTVTLTGPAGSKIILPAGVNATHNGTDNVVLTGTLAAINAALAVLSFSAPAGSNESYLTTSVTAEGVSSEASTSTLIHLHEAPTLVGPSSLPTLVAGTEVSVQGFAVADSDSDRIDVLVKVSGGSATFVHLNVDFNQLSDGTYQLSGAPTDVSIALASMRLKAAESAQVIVTVKVVDNDSVTVDPTLVLSARASAAPTVLTAPTSANIEQGHATALPISIADADSPTVSATITVAGGSVGFGYSGAGPTASGGFGGVATGAGGPGGQGAFVSIPGGVITITGSVAEVNAKLASMKFTATSIGAASLTIVADDGDPTTAAVTKVIALNVGANAAPEAGGDLQVAAVTEDTVSPLTLTGFNLTDSSGGVPTQIRILSVEGGVLTTVGGAPITLGAAGTALNVTLGSLELKFTPAADRTAEAKITYVVVDPDISTQNSAASVITVPITAVNDAPVLALNAAPRVYVENAAPTVLAPGLALSDVDSAQLTSAVVTISEMASTGGLLATGLPTGVTTSADAPSGDLLVVTAPLPSGVTTSFENGVLTITGAASVSAYEAILKSVAYSNLSDAPSTAARQITFKVSDGQALSVERVVDLTVTAVNDAPVVDLNGAADGNDAAASYVRGQTAVALASSASLSDDGETFTQIRVVVTGARVEDALKLDAMAEMSATMQGVTIHEPVYSTVDHTLQLDITGLAISHALAHFILQSVSFSTTAAPGSLGIRFTVTDAAGAVSETRIVSLDVANPPFATIDRGILTLVGDPGTELINVDLTLDSLTGDGETLPISGGEMATVASVDASASASAVQVIGDDAANVIIGSSNSDVIEGSGGADTLTGGGGADRFVFDIEAGSSAASADRVTDLSVGDKIILSTGLTWRGASAERSATQAEAWVETIDGRAYIVFEVDAAGGTDALRYIDIGVSAPGDVASWIYDAASGDLAIKGGSPDAPTVAAAIATGVSAAELQSTFAVAIHLEPGVARAGDTIQMLGRMSPGDEPVVIASKTLTESDLSGVSFSVNPSTLAGFSTEGGKALTARIVSTENGTGDESATLNLIVDTTAPTATINATGAAQLMNGVKTAQIVFSEAVTGFSQSDLSIVNGEIESVTTADNRTFVVTFKQTGPSGAISLTGEYADAAGNAGLKGASLSFTSAAPQIAISDPSARTIDETQHNSGRVVASGLSITDADNHDFAGGSLRAHINNRVGFQSVAGEVLGVRGLSEGSVFFRAVGDDIYYRQGTTVAADGTVTKSDANPADDIRIGSIVTIDGVRQDGSKGADLLINLNENATPAITQALASNIVFSIKLSGGGLTEAWQDFVRPDTSVTFTLSDGQGNTSAVSKPINVVAHNDAPVAVSDVQEIVQAATTPATGNVLANDTDADNVPGLTQQILTVLDVASGDNHVSFVNHSATLQGAYGVLTISDTGAYSYVLNNANSQVAGLVTGENLVDNFTYIVSDGTALASSTLALTINGAVVNVAPVANADEGSINNVGGAAVTGNVLTNDTDANGQMLHVTSVQSGLQGAYGVLTLAADGAYTYTINTTVQALALGETLTDSFTYSISDGHGETATSTLAITINGGSLDAPTAIAFTAEGGAVVAGTVNSSNTNLTGHATITAGQATSGKAELLVNGLVVATDSTILATDTGVDFSLGSSSARALQSALAAGGAVAVKLYDAAGHVISATATSSLAVDYVAPTLTISSSDSVTALKAGETASVTLTFSEAPVGFVAEDLTTTLGTLSSLTVSPTNPKVYTATFTPNADTDLSNGSIALTGAFADAAGNAGTATGPLTFAIDTKAPVAPGLTLLSDTGVSASDGVTSAAEVNISGLESNATWEYKIGGGDWTTGTGASLTLVEGTSVYQVRQTDVAGNVSAISSTTYTLEPATLGENALPEGRADHAQGAPYAMITGNVLMNDVDPDAQTLTVTGADASESDIPDLPANGGKIAGLYGELTIFADGHYVYAPNASAVREGVPLFKMGTENFYYRLTDGHGGDSTATLTIDVVNSPILITGEIGTYTISDTIDGVATAIDTVEIFPGDASAVWNPTGTYKPGDGSHVLSVSAGAQISIYGGAASSTVGLEILDVAHLPQTAAADTLYIVHDTRAHLVNADASTPSALLTNHAIMGVILNGDGAWNGNYETVTDAHIPVIGYDAQISLPMSAQILDEVTIYKHASASETQYVFGFADNDVLGAVGPGTVKIDGGDGDDVMFALANYTSLKGGAGADTFVIGSADIHVRIEDIDLVASNTVLDTTKDILDLSQLFGGMTSTEIDSFVSSHINQTTDAATGKVATVINFNGLGGVAHTGDLTIVGLTNDQADSHMQAQTAAMSSVNYTLLDELRLIASNHG